MTTPSLKERAEAAEKILKPCPLCGGKAQILWAEPEGKDIECEVCKLTLDSTADFNYGNPKMRTMSEMISLWNMRTPSPTATE